MYTISYFKTKHDKTHKPITCSLDELLQKIQMKHQCNKDDLPGFIAGKMKGQQRLKENVISRSLLVYDIDTCSMTEKELFEYIQRQLESYAYCYYTTSSHAFNTPKIRILIALSEDVKAEDFETISKAAFNHLFDSSLQADSTTHEVSRLMYVPTVDAKIFKSSDVSSYDATPLSIEEITNSDSIQNLYQQYCSDKKQQEQLTQYTQYAQDTKIDLTEDQIIEILEQYKSTNMQYSEWLAVAMAISHFFAANIPGEDIFVEWSKDNIRLQEKYPTLSRRVKAVRSQYQRIKNTKARCITFKSVLRNLKIQNPDVFNELVRKDTSIQKAIDVDFTQTLTMSDTIDKVEFVDVIVKKDKFVPLESFANFSFLCKRYGFLSKKNTLTYERTFYVNKDVVDEEVFKGNIRSCLNINGFSKSFFSEMYLAFLEKESIEFNEFSDYSSVWDGVDRLQTFFNTIEVEDQYIELRNAYLLSFFKQMIYITHKTNYKKSPRYVLSLGGTQGAGKSSWIRSLMPASMQQYVLDGKRLNFSNHFDMSSVLKNIICEVCEFDGGLSKREVDDMKALFTSTSQVINEKYMKPKTKQRITSFICTFNIEEIFADHTGNTRFLTLPIKKCNFNHDLDMMQVYAQIKATYDYSDFILDEKFQKIQTEVNRRFCVTSDVDDYFFDYFAIYKDDMIPNHDEYDIVSLNCSEMLQIMGHEITNSMFNKLRYRVGNIFIKNNVKKDQKTKKYTILAKKNVVNDIKQIRQKAIDVEFAQEKTFN